MFIRKGSLQKSRIAGLVLASSRHWFLGQIQYQGRFNWRQWRILWHLRQINITVEKTALEVCVVRIGRRRGCLIREGRERKRKERKKRENNNVVLEACILLVSPPPLPYSPRCQVHPFHSPFRCGRSKNISPLFHLNQPFTELIFLEILTRFL